MKSLFVGGLFGGDGRGPINIHCCHGEHVARRGAILVWPFRSESVEKDVRVRCISDVGVDLPCRQSLTSQSCQDVYGDELFRLQPMRWQREFLRRDGARTEGNNG
jgi:hypothetical protein